MADKEKPSEKAPRRTRTRPADSERASRPAKKAGVSATKPPRPPRAGLGGREPGGREPARREPAPQAEPMKQARGWWQSLKKYLKSVKVEFSRITWPTKQELRSLTIVVIAILIVVTFYLWVVNQVIGEIFARLVGH